MTLDLSELPVKKRRELESNPALLKSLEEAISVNVAKALEQKRRQRRGKAKWQRAIEDVKEQAEEFRQQYSPELQRINENLMKKAIHVVGELACPECGEGDRGNKMNRQPWCVKCNSPLISRNQLEKWVKTPRVKVPHKFRNPTFTGEE